MSKSLIFIFSSFLALQFFLFSTLLSNTSFADPIYRSNDKNGVPVYSSKPKEPNAQPAKLPNIAKERMGEVKNNSLTCVGHGGINCQSGADADGSVICYDNFKDSMQRFAVSCSAAKLAIIPESSKSGMNHFSLIVRNTSAVTARGVKVFADKGLSLEGPSELEAYGSAEYSTRDSSANKAKFQLSCDNCP